VGDKFCFIPADFPPPALRATSPAGGGGHGGGCPPPPAGEGDPAKQGGGGTSDSTWTHFGGNPVSPKWIIEDERVICVVKCPFSSKTDRVATQQSCALDYSDVARTISVAVWWTRGITKARPDKKPLKQCHPRRSVSFERRPHQILRHKVPDWLTPSGMTSHVISSSAPPSRITN